MSNDRRVHGRLLGIDHGLVRIGLAVSDETGLVARELSIIRRTSKREDFAKINHIAAEQRAVALIVGIPTDYARAEQGLYSQADRVRTWVEALREATTLPIVLWDETMSSHEAQELARKQRRKREAPVDDLAARVILQSYLDALRDGLAEPPT
ncbi:MAG: Holliday junction resolvase RuvX [Anaerolineae bacterium]|nr:Holliday junction resolvase RuvX [Anaerolineae bacterium]